MTSELSVRAKWEAFVAEVPYFYLSVFLWILAVTLYWVPKLSCLATRVPWMRDICRPVGESLVVSGVLVLLIDPFLKQRLLKEASRGIFHYLLGFDQQPEIQERLRSILLGTKLFRRNFELRYELTELDSESMQIQTEYTYELVNPTDQTVEFEQKIELESVVKPKLEYISLMSNRGSYQETPAFHAKADDPDVLEIKRPVKIEPWSKGARYRFAAKYTEVYPLRSIFPQHFGFPTIGVTAEIRGPEGFEITATPTPLHVGNVWRYERLFMPADHFNIRWKKPQTSPK